jgi:hypothetical protein
MQRAIGISVHTGWAACVVVGGALPSPAIIASEMIDLLDDSERFCFHMAAQMKRDEAGKWLASVRDKAIANARQAFARLPVQKASVCAIVAKDGDAGSLDRIFASHPRIHTAEGCFYRDVLRETSPLPVHLVPPAALDPGRIGKLAPPPWGRDQKLATLAALRVMSR